VPASAYPGGPGYVPVKAVSDEKVRAQIRAWRVSAVVAVAKENSLLGRYLTAMLGRPAVVAGDVLAWRTKPGVLAGGSGSGIFGWISD
jgi:hypothetical protein